MNKFHFLLVYRSTYQYIKDSVIVFGGEDVGTEINELTCVSAISIFDNRRFLDRRRRLCYNKARSDNGKTEYRSRIRRNSQF